MTMSVNQGPGVDLLIILAKLDRKDKYLKSRFCFSCRKKLKCHLEPFGTTRSILAERNGWIFCCCFSAVGLQRWRSTLNTTTSRLRCRPSTTSVSRASSATATVSSCILHINQSINQSKSLINSCQTATEHIHINCVNCARWYDI